jgi:hypothetical protein
MTEEELYTLRAKKYDEYIEAFGEHTFTNILMSPEEEIAIIDEALRTGKPYYDDYPEGAII